MKHVKINVLVPGLITAEDVLGKGNQLILPQGLVLTDKAIQRLEMYEIKSIRIEDPIDMDIEEIDEDELDNNPLDNIDITELLMHAGEADDIDSFLSKIEEKKKSEPSVSINTLDEPSHFEQIKQSENFKQFKKSFEENVSEFKNQINDIVEKNAPINIDSMLSSTMTLLSSQDNTFGIFDMLHNMRQFDDLTYAHSMNVALICNVFAKWLNLTEEEAKLATACGMLHDIGKLKIDDAVIKKPGKLTDEEYKLIKAHPVEGYKMLQHQDINEHIKNSALMHHEKCDGSGYPLKLNGDRIDNYAKIVAIADVYDAMTSARVYRGALCPFTVIEMFEREGLQKYDIVFIMTFLENVINTYIDNRVLLSDGRIGTVKWIDKQNLSKPMIQLQDNSFLELAKEKNISIVQIL